jgi:hypothetical protein
MQIKIQTSLLSILLFFIVGAHAQSGLNFQGVARNTNNIILASQPISLRLSIIRTSVNGPSEYSEIRKVTTNAQGLFAVVIGDTGSISSIGNFANIDWKLSPKFLKIEMDVAAGNNFILLGTTQFQSVAYAQFANSVDAEKLNGIVPVEKGGTGTTSLAAFKTALSLDKNTVGLSNVNNTADTAKPISNATKVALDRKADTADLVLKASLASPTFTGTVAGITKSMVGLANVDNTADLDKPISNSMQTALESKVNSDSAVFSKDILVNGINIGKGPFNLVNTIIGNQSFQKNITGYSNTAVGHKSLLNSTIENHNTAIGNFSLNSDSLKLGNNNTAIGSQTLRYNESGNNNVAIGNFALYSNGVGSNNTAVGFMADVENPNLIVSNSTAIGSNARVSSSNTIQLGNVDITRVNTSGVLTAAGIQNTPVGTISPTIGKFTDLTITGTAIGINKSMVGLSDVDNTSDLVKPISTATQTALDSKVSSTTFSTTLNTKVSTETFSATIATKENTVNKSTATDLGASATSDILFPTQKAVKTYVDAQINSGGVADGSITSIKLADGAVTGAKFASSITGYKNFVDGAGKLITSNNATPDLILPTGSVPTGGASVWQSFVPTASGKLSLIEFETGNPSSLSGMPPIAYVEIYVGEGIGGTLLGRSNDFTISMFGRTWKSFEFNSIVELYTGNTYTARLVTSTSNQDWVYGDNNLYTFGITNVSSTWDHNFKTSLKVFSNDQFLTSSAGQLLVNTIVSNATHTGDVTGATALTITDDAVTSTKIIAGAITTAKIANAAVDLTTKVTGLLPTTNIADGAVTTAKIANTAVDLTTKVTGLLPTINIADGAITTAKLANTAVDLTTKVTGLLPTTNGGTGTITATANTVFASPNGSNGSASFRALVAADIPNNLTGYIQNTPSLTQTGSIKIDGIINAGSIQNTPIGNTTPTTASFTTLTTSGNTSIGGTLTVTGTTYFTTAPILSSATASKALFTNGNKEMVSNNITGTGNVVMSASPTLTGTVSVGTISSTQDLLVNGIKIGVGAGNNNTNTAIGSNALIFNSTGEGNTAIGYQSLLLNTIGTHNTGLGYGALTKNIGGGSNIAIGNLSLFENTSGGSNIALGNQSLYKNTTGSSNLALGYLSLFNNSNGVNNIAIGDQSLTNNTSGANNFAAGYLSMLANSTGTDNIAIGDNSLFFNNANNNIGLGKTTLFYNQNGASNYAGGYKALFNNTSGSYNIAIGFESLKTNSTASNNIGIGKSTLTNLQNGINNIAIGNNAGFNSLYTTNNIIIGNDAQASSDIADNEITLGNSSITTIRSAASGITSLSDRRDKTDIQTITEGIDFIKQLKPVSFTWNTRDKSKVGLKSAGFIAQDLLTLQKASSIGANLDLVSENNPEKLEARYNNLLPVMVKAIQEQQNIIEDQKKRLDALEKMVNELLKKQ